MSGQVEAGEAAGVAQPIGAALEPGDPHVWTVGPSTEVAEALSTAYDQAAAHRWAPAPLFQLALARIDGRADRSACLDALPRDLIFDKRWLSALRARDPAEP